jgi:hypothetical protein
MLVGLVTPVLCWCPLARCRMVGGGGFNCIVDAGVVEVCDSPAGYVGDCGTSMVLCASGEGDSSHPGDSDSLS